MFERLFGKKDKFFRELKEDASKAVGQAVEQAEKAIEKTTETIGQVVDSKTAEPAKVEKAAQGKSNQVANKVEKAAQDKSNQIANKVEKAAQGKSNQIANAVAALTGKTKEKKTSVKDKKAKEKTEATKPVVEAKPAPTSQNGKVEPTEVAFASKNPVTSTMSRRTPGPSMNTFKEMARTAKIPTRRS